MSFNNLSQVINYVRNDRGGGKRSWSYAGTRIGGRRGWRHVGGGGRGGNEKEVTVTLLEGEEEEGVTGAVLGGEEEGVGGAGPDSERGGGGTCFCSCAGRRWR